MIRWPWRRRPADARKRVLRIVLDVDGQAVLDTSSALILAQIDCHFGRPVVREFAIPADAMPGGWRVARLTVSEVES